MSYRSIDVVAGARPNFIKIAPILRVFNQVPTELRARLVHTGQHYDDDMSRVFFRQLEIPEPHLHLGVGSGSHATQAARIMTAFERHLLGADPPSAGVVVVGDVNSTMACALTATKLGIPLAHVEAGLRSFDRTMPEEINRIVTDAVADLLLVSEPSGEKNLQREGKSPEQVKLVGNVMIDTLVRQLPVARSLATAADLGLPERYSYATIHRPANVDTPKRLSLLVELLLRVARRLPVVLPAHPRTRARLQEFGLLQRFETGHNIHLLEPLGYVESLSLMASSTVVFTDSGGIQEETTYLRIPCLTLRPNTERPVTVDVGTSTLVGSRLEEVEPLVDEILAGRYKAGQPVPLWDGHAAERIVTALTAAWS